MTPLCVVLFWLRCVSRTGLVRFASEQYSSSKSSLKHATMHLTNYSINKKPPNFKQPGSSKQQQQDASATDADGGADGNASGSDAGDESCSDSYSSSSEAAANKWSFGQLAEHLRQQGHSWETVWQQVC
jgi:hypothetical protein